MKLATFSPLPELYLPHTDPLVFLLMRQVHLVLMSDSDHRVSCRSVSETSESVALVSGPNFKCLFIHPPLTPCDFSSFLSGTSPNPQTLKPNLDVPSPGGRLLRLTPFKRAVVRNKIFNNCCLMWSSKHAHVGCLSQSSPNGKARPNPDLHLGSDVFTIRSYSKKQAIFSIRNFSECFCKYCITWKQEQTWTKAGVKGGLHQCYTQKKALNSTGYNGSFSGRLTWWFHLMCGIIVG